MGYVSFLIETKHGGGHMRVLKIFLAVFLSENDTFLVKQRTQQIPKAWKRQLLDHFVKLNCFQAVFDNLFSSTKLYRKCNFNKFTVSVRDYNQFNFFA